MSARILPFPSPLGPRSRDGYDAIFDPLTDLAGALHGTNHIRPTRAQEIAAILRAPRDDGPAAA